MRSNQLSYPAIFIGEIPKPPAAFRLSDVCKQKSRPGRASDDAIASFACSKVVEIEGLEPSLTEPESVVLPLHHISIWLSLIILGLQRYECFVKMQNFC